MPLWVPAGHYYSPLVNPNEAAVQRALELEESPNVAPVELGISEEQMLEWFGRIAGHYPGHPFPEHPANGLYYYYANPHFPLADALGLLAFMRSSRPRRLIEIGSGFSSCAVIDINQRYLGGSVKLTLIEPHPNLVLELIGSQLPCDLLKKPLQEVPLAVFEELEANDILFIDSSHVAKTGSDVLDYMFRVLPCLKPDVWIHIHDIFYPFEYPKAWIVDQNRSWNEAYLLRAFLTVNSSFQVEYWSDYFYKCRRRSIEERMPLCIAHRGGSVWLKSCRAGAI